MSQKSGVRVICHRDIADLGLRGAWRALEATGTATPFQTLAFADCFTRNVLPNHQASALFFQVLDGAGNTLMILPMITIRRRGVILIESFDLDLADYVMPLLAKDVSFDVSLFDEIWRLIREQMPKADAVYLKKLPENIDGVNNPLKYLAGVRPMGIFTHPMPIVTPVDIKAFRSSGLYDDFRKRQRKAAREGHQVETELATTAEQAEVFFRQLVAFRYERFVKLKRCDGLQNEAVFNFYLELAKAGAIDGSVVLLAMKVDGEIVAVNYGLVHAGRCVVVMVGANTEKWSSFSPGLINFVNMADWAIAQNLKVYDLGVGDLTYKRRFRSLPCPMLEWNSAITWRGRVYVALSSARRILRVFLERYPKLNLWVRKIRGR